MQTIFRKQNLKFYPISVAHQWEEKITDLPDFLINRMRRISNQTTFLHCRKAAFGPPFNQTVPSPFAFMVWSMSCSSDGADSFPDFYYPVYQTNSLAGFYMTSSAPWRTGTYSDSLFIPHFTGSLFFRCTKVKLNSPIRSFNIILQIQSRS